MSIELTDAEWASLAAEFCKGFSTEQADVCRTFCRLRGLIPGKHVVFQLRRGKEWDEFVGAKVAVTKIVFITTIDAARLIALRSGEYTGQDSETYIYLDKDGAPSIESKIPLPQLPVVPGQTALPREPWAVRTTVYRKSFTHPITSVARFDAYASTYKTQDGIQLTEMWQKRGPEQLAKCSEMLSLRKSFPEELSSLYLDLELKNDPEEEKLHAVTPVSVVPQLPVVPKVNQTPATPTDAPRPNETVKVSEVIQTTALPPAPPVDPALTEALLKAKTAVPELKTAAELPPPPKKKTGRPSKASPVNGRDVAAEGGITQADVDNVEQNQAPVVDEAADRKAATDFVNSVTNFTSEEAAAQGLSEPPDHSKIPSKEAVKEFHERARKLRDVGGANSQDIKNYLLASSTKDDTRLMTVGDWTEALEKLEAAQQAGTLKEVTKNAPLPAF